MVFDLLYVQSYGRQPNNTDDHDNNEYKSRNFRDKPCKEDLFLQLFLFSRKEFFTYLRIMST